MQQESAIAIEGAADDLPLSGIRVIDLCIILAGPTCGRTLAEYGAEVIKVDSWHRPPSDRQLHDVGRGKRSVCLELTKPAGLEAFYRLVDTADVVLGGFRKGVAERLGIGYEQLRRRKPNIIYLAINAFGQAGDWANRPGYEQNAQAATGVQVRNGGRGAKPIHSPFTFNDYGTGLTGAYAAMLALLHRRRTGMGQFAHISLAQTGSTFSSPFLIDYPGFERHEIEGLDARRLNALAGLYQAADGWLAIAAEAHWDALASIPDFAHLAHRPEFATPELRSRNDAALAHNLSAAFARKPIADWLPILRAAGVPAVKNAAVPDLMNAAYTRAQGLVVEEDAPDGKVTHGGFTPHFSLTPPRLGATPQFGEETEAVLLELGYDVADLDALRADGVIPPLE